LEVNTVKGLLIFGLMVVIAVVFVVTYKAWAVEIQVKEGQKAPDFELMDQEGKTVRLSDYRGKGWVVLYFYPKDDTPGCTKEACSFRDNLNQLQALNTTVLGVSVDDIRSHKNFSEKFNLNFPILSDTEYKVCKRYGTLSSMMGIKLAHRSTFIIDPDGIVRKVFPNVQPKDHAIEVAQVLKELQKEES
ncbi:MAG: peroxiredoxin, partial [Nitrospira sp.]|nr:peroxiredoxin [Nitrospira sp.]